MTRKVTIWMLCLVATIIWTGLVYAQTTKPGTMKTIKLPNGEEVYDLNGEWDVIVENYGELKRLGTYPQVFKITQEGSSFTGIRLKDNPAPVMGIAGSKCMEGELDKTGFKKLEILVAGGGIYPTSKWEISEDGNKINIDVPQRYRFTLTRK